MTVHAITDAYFDEALFDFSRRDVCGGSWAEKALQATGRYRAYTRKIVQYGASDSTTGTPSKTWPNEVSIQGVLTETRSWTQYTETGPVLVTEAEFESLDGLAFNDLVYDAWSGRDWRVSTQPRESSDKDGFASRKVTVQYPAE